MKAVVIDDFRLARLEMIALISQYNDIQVVAEAENGDQAIEILKKHKPDVIFTDINMPGTSVFDFLEDIDEKTNVVFTSAYSEYALKTFSFNTIDYLLKPVSNERFAQTVEKLRKKINQTQIKETDASLGMANKILVKKKSDYILKSVAEIVRLESGDTDSLLHFMDGICEINKPLSYLEKRLPEDFFYRVSRQCIVNIQFTKSIAENASSSGHSMEMQDGYAVDVTRRQFAKIKEALSI